MLGRVTRNYLLPFLLVGLAMLGGSRTLQCQSCCVSIKVNTVTCVKGTCKTTITWNKCIAGGVYAVDYATLYCCGVQFSSAVRIDECLIAGPTQSASITSSSRTRTFYLLDCSGKYVLVNVPMPEA